MGVLRGLWVFLKFFFSLPLILLKLVLGMQGIARREKADHQDE